MSTFNLIQQTDDSYSVEGDLTFSSLNKKELESISFLTSAKKIDIDLAKVNLADTAGLALIIEWIKQSKQCATTLTFKNTPKQLITLASLSGIDINENLTAFLIKEH